MWRKIGGADSFATLKDLHPYGFQYSLLCETK